MAELRLFWDYMNEQLDRIRRVVSVLEAENVRYAVMGGHAVSYHVRLRVTVDVDFLVAARSLARVETELAAAGFLVEKRGEILRAWEAGMDPSTDEPVVDLVPAEHNKAQLEALRTAVAVRYQGLELRMITRAALVALKYLSAISPHRAHLDKLQDVTDLGKAAKKSWTPEDAREARRLVELSHPGVGADFERLVDDLLHERPVTI